MFSSLWQQCLSIFESNIPEKQIITWLKPLELNSDDGLNFQLLAPNRWVKNWVTQHYLSTIEQTMLQLHDQMLSVTIVDELNDATTANAPTIGTKPIQNASASTLADTPGVITNNDAISSNLTSQGPVTIDS
ncbi:MAG: hypothetical protein HRU38_20170, partial [Saccharospirillaceae bacterium]|nr:hypothetical protein [Pseudomonadales bacterium]NRB80949.1 hypothetical protein [Saccharospirillaceae bacterium]